MRARRGPADPGATLRPSSSASRRRLSRSPRIISAPSGETTSADAVAAVRRRPWRSAPMGTWQPPPSARSTARSAVHGGVRRGMVERARRRRSRRPSARVSMASAPCPTAGHITSGRQNLRDAVAPAQALQAGGGQQDGVVLPFIQLCAGAYRGCRAPIRSARSGRSLRSCAARRSELVPTFAPAGRSRQLAADHGVARVFALRNGRQHQAFGQFGRQIFQAVDRQIGAAVEQRFLDLLGEQALVADLGQRHVGDLVAGGLDDLDAALVAQRGECALDPAGLPRARVANRAMR